MIQNNDRSVLVVFNIGENFLEANIRITCCLERHALMMTKACKLIKLLPLHRANDKPPRASFIADALKLLVLIRKLGRQDNLRCRAPSSRERFLHGIASINPLSAS